MSNLIASDNNLMISDGQGVDLDDDIQDNVLCDGSITYRVNYVNKNLY